MALNDLVTKINRILEGLMGCKIDFQPSNLIRRELWRAEELSVLMDGDLTRVGGNPPYLRSLDEKFIGFPVNLHGRFSGLAVVKGWQGANSDQMILLAELVTEVLEQGLEKDDKNERLKAIEEHMTLASALERGDSGDVKSNVIQLHSPRIKRRDEAVDAFDVELPTAVSSEPLTITPILIEASASFPLERIAIEIHHMSRRWALVKLEDLSGDILSSRAGLKELGGVTLFIRDLESLSIERQLKLAEYLSTQPDAEMPHIVAGLRAGAERTVLPHLIDLFTKTELRFEGEVTRQFVDASLKQIMESAAPAPDLHKVGAHFIPFNVKYFDPDQPIIH